MLREVGIGYDVSGHPFAAQAVLQGIVVEKDRAAVAASVAPDRGAQEAVEAALADRGLAAVGPPRTGADRRSWGEWLQRIVGRHTEHQTFPTDDELARIGWCVQDVRVRDAAWALIRRPDAERHQMFWADAVRRMPEALVPAAGGAARAGPPGRQDTGRWPGSRSTVVRRSTRPTAWPRSSPAASIGRVPPDSVACDFAWDEGLPA